jgi:hypothetical protein
VEKAHFEDQGDDGERELHYFRKQLGLLNLIEY